MVSTGIYFIAKDYGVETWNVPRVKRANPFLACQRRANSREDLRQSMALIITILTLKSAIASNCYVLPLMCFRSMSWPTVIVYLKRARLSYCNSETPQKMFCSICRQFYHFLWNIYDVRDLFQRESVVKLWLCRNQNDSGYLLAAMLILLFLPLLVLFG